MAKEYKIGRWVSTDGCESWRIPGYGYTYLCYDAWVDYEWKETTQEEHVYWSISIDGAEVDQGDLLNACLIMHYKSPEDIVKEIEKNA